MTAIDWLGSMRPPEDVPPDGTEAILLATYQGERGEVREVLIGDRQGQHWMALTAHGSMAFDIVGWWPLPPLDLKPAAGGLEPPGLPYGVIDPDYARIFTIARCLAWAEGYAMMMHGSFTRDLDLLAVPWAEKACEPEHLVRRIEQAAGLRILIEGPGSPKPHGRRAWTLVLPGFGDPRFVDIGVMPRAPAAPTE